MSEPESVDPIYNDLAKRRKQLDQQIAKQEGTLEELLRELMSPEMTFGQRKKIAEHQANAHLKIRKFDQQRHYLDLQLEKRKLEARKEYLKAFQAKLPWPDPSEITKYQTARRLRTANQDWSRRVPKSNRHNVVKVQKREERRRTAAESEEEEE